MGESLAALPLIEKLLAGGSVLVTSGTVTSAKMMAKRLPKGAIHQFVPLDMPQRGERAFWIIGGRMPACSWNPISGPTCFWPRQARGVRLALINARISERSAAGWQRAPRSAPRPDRRLRRGAGAG